MATSRLLSRAVLKPAYDHLYSLRYTIIDGLVF